LANFDDVVVVERAQVLDFAQGSDRKSLVEHVFHQHFQLFKREVLHFLGYWVAVFSFVNFAEGAFSYLLNVREVGEFVLFEESFALARDPLDDALRGVQRTWSAFELFYFKVLHEPVLVGLLAFVLNHLTLV
jgi:hypothetical protein